MLRARRDISPTEDTKYLPQLEILEPRLALTSSLSACDNLPLTLSHGGACSCPICSGQNLDGLFPADIAQADTTGSGGLSAASPISALPQLSSNSGARVKLYLDFNGNFEATWGSYSNCTTRVFDRDGDATTFSDSEISTIREIWARVAEDYAPFNIDVTTIDPGAITNGNAVRLAIGGNYSDWFGQSAGGVAYIGGFTNGASNTGYVFEDALGNGNARYVAEATSHEAGHLFGLLHQSTWVNGQLQDEYNAGNSNWAPVMGVGYYANRTTWHNGNTNQGAGVYQDDVSILANGTNNFGLRADDYSNSFTAPSNLPVSGTGVNFGGLIGSRTDVDVFQFTTVGGNVNLQMSVAQFGNNLDGAIEIRNSAGVVMSVSDPSDSFGASLSTTLAAGSYFLVARGSGTFGNSAYGNLGQYTITGTLAPPAPAPEVSVFVGTSGIADGGTIDFGSTQVGTPVDRVVTVRNDGNTALSVNSITSAIPAGFTLISDLSATTLQAGQSVSFTLRLNAAAVGSFSGDIAFTNSDANEGTYDLHLQGTVTAITNWTIDDGDSGHTLTGTWGLGTGGRAGDTHVAVGATSDTAVSRWTFDNLVAGQYRVYLSWTGNSLNASNAPVTVVAGTQILGTTFHNQRVASTGYTADGTNWVLVRSVTITGNMLRVVLSNKANGSVVADAVRIERIVTVPAAEISVLVGTSGIADGGTIDFGSTQANTAVDRVVTVRNDGTANLSVNSITTAMPAGFTLVSNLSTTTLQPGQSVTFTLRLNATADGSFSGNISFTNSDANEGTYDLRLQGTVTARTNWTIDDGDVGNTPTGNWTVGTGGRTGDTHVAAQATSATAVSRWTFENLVAGQYRVYMSWTGNSLNASNAPVTIVAGTQNLGTTYHNQRVPSSGYTADGTNWVLVRNVTITGNMLRAVLSNNANGNVVADAVRIERVVTSSAVAHGAVSNIGGGGTAGTGSAGTGILVAALSSHWERHGESAANMFPKDLRSDSNLSQPHVAALQSALDLDLAPELGLLEDTLDLVREVSRHVRSSESTSGLEGLFEQDSDWLAVL